MAECTGWLSGLINAVVEGMMNPRNGSLQSEATPYSLSCALYLELDNHHLSCYAHVKS